MVELLLRRCGLAKASVLASPRPDAEQVTELLFGEVVEVTERVGHWAHITLARDSYRGWVVDAALIPDVVSDPHEISHYISKPSSLIFARPDIKSPLMQRLYYGSPILASQADGGFHRLASGGFIHRRHIAAQSIVEADPVAVAMRFAGAPYLWGGRTCDGIDCSALVQTALLACGVACPRDTGDQRAVFAAYTITDSYRRGDLLFFPGHVGIMVDDTNLLHANAFWMTTLVEPLTAVVDRFSPAVVDPILAVIRLFH